MGLVADADRTVQAAAVAVRQLVFPPACLACGDELDGTDSNGSDQVLLCDGCLSEIVAEAPACQRCATDVGEYVDTSGGCVACRGERYRFDAAIRLGHYTGKLRLLCLAFKEQRHEYVGRTLAELLWRYRGDELAALRADLVVAVPLHPLRRLVRGYNQAELLAGYLAERLNVPHRSHLLRRRRWTIPQSRLGRQQRRSNVTDAFVVRRRSRVDKLTVLLIDDILTTGSTCSEAARALKRAGARRVVVAVVARS